MEPRSARQGADRSRHVRDAGQAADRGREAVRLPCWACGRAIKRRPRHGKQTFPHKCPHGVQCIAGTRLGGQGHNGPTLGGPNYCAACVASAKAKEPS